MKESSKTKIQNICDQIKQEAIEPAQQQAKEIIENARLQAEEIVAQAKKERDSLLEKCDKELADKKNQVEAALRLAGRQTLTTLRQKVGEEFFSSALQKEIKEASSKEDVVAQLISSLVEAIKKEGLDGDLVAYVGKIVSAQDVAKHLTQKITEKLQNQEIIVGDFHGGAKISLKDSNITLDMSDEALFELFSEFLRKDFYQLMFGEKQIK